MSPLDLKNKLNNKFLFKILLYFMMPNSIYGQIDNYYVNTNKKHIERTYYFKVMDSLVAAAPNDTIYECINCVRFMTAETKIRSSGKVTYFGQLEFTKEDLRKWHNYYTKKYNKKRKKIY